MARKSHRDSAVRFVTAKSCPERVTTTRQYDLLRPRVGQKDPPRFGRTFCYGQELARKSHQDSAVRFVTAKSWPESHQHSAVRFVTTKSWPERATETRQYDLLRPRVGPERATKTRQYDLLRPRAWARKSHQDSAVRFVTAKSSPERAPTLGSTICYGQELSRKSHHDSAVRFCTDKSWPEKATKPRQYDLLRPRVGQKEPPRLGSTICYGQTWARKSHQDSVLRFVTAKSWPERATETRQYDLLWPRVGQKEPPRLGSTICYGQELARKSHQDSAVRFVTAKSWPERATKTRQYDLLRPRRVPERATKTRQYDLLRPNVGQKEPPRQYDLLRPRVGKKEPLRLGSRICYGQTWATKSHQDSAVRFVPAKRGPERASKTRHYDLLRPRVGQKEPPRLVSTI